MLGVGTVKLTPLLGAEGSKEGMIKQFDIAAKPPPSIGEGSIHGYQRVVESLQGILVQAVFRNRMFGSGTS